MPQTLRKMAPLLLLAGVALMPRRARRTSPRAENRPRPSPLGDRARPDRSTTDSGDATEPGRGRHADAPQEIPPRGWKDIVIRAWKEFRDDEVPLVSAGVTFYGLLALFPGLGVLVSLYGLFADVAEAREHLRLLSYVLPPDALRLIGDQMVRISAANTGGLSAALLGSLALSVWSANGAMKAMIQALNIAYEEQEKRSFVRKTLVSLAFTVGFLMFGVAAIGALAAPAAIEPFAGKGAADLLRWISRPALVGALGIAISLLYRYGPSRDEAKWRWITWGSGAVLLVWMAMSAAFSLYAANFAHYDKTYGSLGAVIGLMMWIYLSAQIVLFGAELNSEIEHQTLKDTTVGAARPLGQRGAVMADTVGAAQR